MVVTLAMMYGLTELQILIVSEQDGQDQKRVHHRDSRGILVQRQSQRGRTEKVWTDSGYFGERMLNIAAREEKKNQITEEGGPNKQ